MFPAQLIQTARAINYIKTFLARVSYQSCHRIEGSDFTRMLMTRGRSSTLVTHLLMCNKLYNLIFLGDKRIICNRIYALMSTHIYINTGCFIENDRTYRKDLTNGTVRPKGIAHRQSRLIEALLSNASLAYLHYLRVFLWSRWP